MSLLYPNVFQAPGIPSLRWTASRPMWAMQLMPNRDLDASEQADSFFYHSCSHESQRAEAVCLQLQRMLKVLPPGNHAYLVAIIDGVRDIRFMLRELADLSQIYKDRIPVVLNNLHVILPCVFRTLKDINKFYADQSLSVENRWRKMYHSMTNEAEGLPLPQRFILYIQFITCLKHLLLRTPDFDFNMLETSRLQIMALRAAREIPLPTTPTGPLVRFDPAASPSINPDVHWAEHIFSLPLPSRRELHCPLTSTTFEPQRLWEDLNLPSDHKTLFRRPFDNDRISLIGLLRGPERAPYLLSRTFHQGIPWFSLQGVHELCIDRDGPALYFKRWSRREDRPRPWAILHFKTWEELVLLHSTFISLKFRGSMTMNLSPNECQLHGEKKLIQCRIKDGDFDHDLILYEDRLTQSIRLQAAVWVETLRQCPVWTIFLTEQCTHQGWLRRVSPHKIHLYGIRPYVFCRQYRQQSQWRGDAFEIVFFKQEACDVFEDLLLDFSRPMLSDRPAQPPPPPPEAEHDSELEPESDSSTASGYHSDHDTERSEEY